MISAPSTEIDPFDAHILALQRSRRRWTIIWRLCLLVAGALIATSLLVSDLRLALVGLVVLLLGWQVAVPNTRINVEAEADAHRFVQLRNEAIGRTSKIDKGAPTTDFEAWLDSVDRVTELTIDIKADPDGKLPDKVAPTTLAPLVRQARQINAGLLRSTIKDEDGNALCSYVVVSGASSIAATEHCFAGRSHVALDLETPLDELAEVMSKGGPELALGRVEWDEQQFIIAVLRGEALETIDPQLDAIAKSWA